MLSKNIKVLFKNVIYNCPVVNIKDREIIYKVGDDFVSILIFKKTKEKIEEINPLSIENVRALNFFDCGWTVYAPLYKDLPIYTYTIKTSFRNYHINDLTLSEQEEFANQINSTLKQFEEDYLAKLMTASLQ